MTKPPARQESRNQVRQILAVMNRHGDVISDAVDGTVDLRDAAYNTGIDALVGINALMPFEEGQYQLNPRIRSFLSEQLAQYSAFQALTRISDQIHGARTKWRELVHIKESGDLRDMAALEESLGYTVNEIVHFTVQNLLLLNIQISTDYGNVETLKAKLRQNAFYGNGVKNLAAELEQLEAFTIEIDRGALSKGLHSVRHMVNTRIRSRLGMWMSRLNDVQATITKRLFIAKKLDSELMYLSKAVLWLTRNPTRGGFEVFVDEKVDAALLRPVAIKVRPQVDVSDAGAPVQDIYVKAIQRLKPMPDPWERKETVIRQYVLSTAVKEIEAELTIEDALMEELVDALYESDEPYLSVSQWQPEKRAMHAIDTESWLLYAAGQLHMMGMHVEFNMTERQAGVFNDVFEDVLVSLPESEDSELEAA